MADAHLKHVVIERAQAEGVVSTAMALRRLLLLLTRRPTRALLLLLDVPLLVCGRRRDLDL